MARVAILGLGAVGRALMRQIAGMKGSGIGVIGVADSTGGLAMLRTPLSSDELLDLVSHKERGGKVGDWCSDWDSALHGRGMRLVRPEDVVLCLPDSADYPRQEGAVIVADCSNSDTSVSSLRLAVARGFRVASANKKPFADSSMQVFEELTKWPGSCRFESTAGAATPFVATAMRLRSCNDLVHSALGSMSGTLGYLMSELERASKPRLSVVLQRAIDLGYTEPDARDDLSGVDVQRKAVIIARVLGAKISMADVPVEALYPPPLSLVPYAEFVERVCKRGELDEQMAERIESARANRCVLRYVASVSLQSGTTVGLQAVPADSPLGRLTGTGNLLQFKTKYFGEQELVLQGAGAGGENTASGVLADIVELAHCAAPHQ